METTTKNKQLNAGGVGVQEMLPMIQLKRKHQASKNNNNDKNRKKYKKNHQREGANQVDQNEKDDIHYVIRIDENSELECNIGGAKLKMLVDSEYKCNLITGQTWQKMKNDKVMIHKQNQNPNKTFYGYGSIKPLHVIGSFEANLQIEGRSENATFYIIADGIRNLLGKDTAISMGVLRIGLPVNQMEKTTSFPRFKDVLIEIPIDKKVQPVSQPYRRIPIPLEEKISNKIKELIERDIIEEVHSSSKWVSPIVPVLKDNVKVRLCVDMR
ncbi:unnamed protein product [Parnassius apollo]|uniref:(apollo) hypothetical protein n=1 Tax=Parnassius apollo TaxID=110799 RepID=A0A8S3W288_PARAO|nr:unnamed protein product [Parnassius apollo]